MSKLTLLYNNNSCFKFLFLFSVKGIVNTVTPQDLYVVKTIQGLYQLSNIVKTTRVNYDLNRQIKIILQLL
jgi:hypothetical protein